MKALQAVDFTSEVWSWNYFFSGYLVLFSNNEQFTIVNQQCCVLDKYAFQAKKILSTGT